MLLIEERKNIFSVTTSKRCIVVPMGADYVCTGNMKEFELSFHLREKLTEMGPCEMPDCIRYGPILALIIKPNKYRYPEIEDIKGALDKMKEIIKRDKIRGIAMPRLGQDEREPIEWPDLRDYMFELFQHEDTDILVCHY